MNIDLKQPKPGIYHDVPFDDYLQIDARSQSVLKHARVSMAHLRDAEQTEVKATDEMNLGSALHACYLEPERLIGHVVLWNGGSRRGKEWEAFQQEHAGKIILTPGYYEKMKGMTQSLRRHPELRKWIGRIEAVEVTGVAEIEGVVCKGRADALTDDPLCDLKSCNSNLFQRAIADPRKWKWHIEDMGYDIQVGLYTLIFEREHFMFYFVESSSPYCVACVNVGEAMIRRAQAEVIDILNQYKECSESGEWPGPFEHAITVDEDDGALGVRISA